MASLPTLYTELEKVLRWKYKCDVLTDKTDTDRQKILLKCYNGPAAKEKAPRSY